MSATLAQIEKCVSGLVKKNRPTDVPALEFHCALNALFARLQDAHTTYTLSSAVFQVVVGKL